MLAAQADEGFDRLARLVSSALKPAGNHSILVVTTGPKNRAPYSAFNLAAEVSKLGRRVLLVDGGASHDPLMTAMLLPEKAENGDAGNHYGVETIPLLKFSPADRRESANHAAPLDDNGDAFDLVVIDGGVAAKSGLEAQARRGLDEVFLMQHEEDTGSVVIALVSLEESGLENIRVLRMTRSGLQF